MLNLRYFIVLSLLFTANICIAQSSKKAKLQTEYNSILQEIKQLQASLDHRKKQQDIGLKEVALITDKIEKRNKLIQNIEFQKTVIENEMGSMQGNVTCIKEEAEKLKIEYAKLIRWLNKNHNSVNKLAFVLEAQSFKEAYHRMRYIQKYGDFRAKQTQYLRNQAERILKQIGELNVVKQEKANIIEANQFQKKQLVKEKEERDVVIKKISNEVALLKGKVEKKNQQAAAINSKIKSIIEAEIKKQREKMLAEKKRKQKEANASGRVLPKSEKSNTITKEELAQTPEGILSSNFQLSRGKMPWPVSSGMVTSKFGRQAHPADKTLFVDNNGIDIKTNDNADIKSIYKGQVVNVFSVPELGTCILVKHGEFFTVYSYVKNARVKSGDMIQAGQAIGKALFSAQHGYSLVNLQVWNESNKDNPLAWLSPK